MHQNEDAHRQSHSIFMMLCVIFVSQFHYHTQFDKTQNSNRYFKKCSANFIICKHNARWKHRHQRKNRPRISNVTCPGCREMGVSLATANIMAPHVVPKQKNTPMACPFTLSEQTPKVKIIEGFPDKVSA
jgi:hypothetical protein